MFNIFGLDVNKVSLVTSNELPAVPKATTKFSFFKMLKTKEIDVAKIEELQKRLKK